MDSFPNSSSQSPQLTSGEMMATLLGNILLFINKYLEDGAMRKLISVAYRSAFKSELSQLNYSVKNCFVSSGRPSSPGTGGGGGGVSLDRLKQALEGIRRFVSAYSEPEILRKMINAAYRKAFSGELAILYQLVVRCENEVMKATYSFPGDGSDVVIPVDPRDLSLSAPLVAFAPGLDGQFRQPPLPPNGNGGRSGPSHPPPLPSTASSGHALPNKAGSQSHSNSSGQYSQLYAQTSQHQTTSTRKVSSISRIVGASRQQQQNRQNPQAVFGSPKALPPASPMLSAMSPVPHFDQANPGSGGSNSGNRGGMDPRVLSSLIDPNFDLSQLRNSAINAHTNIDRAAMSLPSAVGSNLSPGLGMGMGSPATSRPPALPSLPTSVAATAAMQSQSQAPNRFTVMNCEDAVDLLRKCLSMSLPQSQSSAAVSEQVDSFVLAKLQDVLSFAMGNGSRQETLGYMGACDILVALMERFAGSAVICAQLMGILCLLYKHSIPVANNGAGANAGAITGAAAGSSGVGGKTFLTSRNGCEVVAATLDRFADSSRAAEEGLKTVVHLAFNNLQNQTRFVAAGLCAIIAKLLELHVDSEEIVRQGCLAIITLSYNNPGSQLQFASSGVCRALLAVIDRHFASPNGVAVLTQAFWALRNLSCASAENGRCIMDLGMHKVIVRALSHYGCGLGANSGSSSGSTAGDATLTEQLYGVATNLTSGFNSKQYQDMFAAAGAAKAMAESLKAQSAAQTQSQSKSQIGGSSGSEAFLPTLEWGLIALQCLVHQHFANQDAVNAVGGFDTVVRELRVHLGSASISRLCCMCISELAPAAVEAGKVSTSVNGSDTCKALVSALDAHRTDPRVVEAGCKAIACVALSEDLQPLMLRLGACEAVAHALTVQFQIAERDATARSDPSRFHFGNHEAVRQAIAAVSDLCCNDDMQTRFGDPKLLKTADSRDNSRDDRSVISIVVDALPHYVNMIGDNSVVACALDAILNLSDGNVTNKEALLKADAASTIINLVAAKTGDADTDTLCRAFNTAASLAANHLGASRAFLSSELSFENVLMLCLRRYKDDPLVLRHVCVVIESIAATVTPAARSGDDNSNSDSNKENVHRLMFRQLYPLLVQALDAHLDNASFAEQASRAVINLSADRENSGALGAAGLCDVCVKLVDHYHLQNRDGPALLMDVNANGASSANGGGEYSMQELSCWLAANLSNAETNRARLVAAGACEKLALFLSPEVYRGPAVAVADGTGAALRSFLNAGVVVEASYALCVLVQGQGQGQVSGSEAVMALLRPRNLPGQMHALDRALAVAHAAASSGNVEALAISLRFLATLTTTGSAASVSAAADAWHEQCFSGATLVELTSPPTSGNTVNRSQPTSHFRRRLQVVVASAQRFRTTEAIVLQAATILATLANPSVPASGSVSAHSNANTNTNVSPSTTTTAPSSSSTSALAVAPAAGHLETLAVMGAVGVCERAADCLAVFSHNTNAYPHNSNGIVTASFRVVEKALELIAGLCEDPANCQKLLGDCGALSIVLRALDAAAVAVSNASNANPSATLLQSQSVVTQACRALYALMIDSRSSAHRLNALVLPLQGQSFGQTFSPAGNSKQGDSHSNTVAEVARANKAIVAVLRDYVSGSSDQSQKGRRDSHGLVRAAFRALFAVYVYLTQAVRTNPALASAVRPKSATHPQGQTQGQPSQQQSALLAIFADNIGDVGAVEFGCLAIAALSDMLALCAASGSDRPGANNNIKGGRPGSPSLLLSEDRDDGFPAKDAFALVIRAVRTHSGHAMVVQRGFAAAVRLLHNGYMSVSSSLSRAGLSLCNEHAVVDLLLGALVQHRSHAAAIDAAARLLNSVSALCKLDESRVSGEYELASLRNAWNHVSSDAVSKALAMAVEAHLANAPVVAQCIAALRSSLAVPKALAAATVSLAAAKPHSHTSNAARSALDESSMQVDRHDGLGFGNLNDTTAMMSVAVATPTLDRTGVTAGMRRGNGTAIGNGHTSPALSAIRRSPGSDLDGLPSELDAVGFGLGLGPGLDYDEPAGQGLGLGQLHGTSNDRDRDPDASAVLNGLAAARVSGPNSLDLLVFRAVLRALSEHLSNCAGVRSPSSLLVAANELEVTANSAKPTSRLQVGRKGASSAQQVNPKTTNPNTSSNPNSSSTSTIGNEDAFLILEDALHLLCTKLHALLPILGSGSTSGAGGADAGVQVAQGVIYWNTALNPHYASRRQFGLRKDAQDALVGFGACDVLSRAAQLPAVVADEALGCMVSAALSECCHHRIELQLKIAVESGACRGLLAAINKHALMGNLGLLGPLSAMADISLGCPQAATRFAAEGALPLLMEVLRMRTTSARIVRSAFDALLALLIAERNSGNSGSMSPGGRGGVSRYGGSPINGASRFGSPGSGYLDGSPGNGYVSSASSVASSMSATSGSREIARSFLGESGMAQIESITKVVRHHRTQLSTLIQSGASLRPVAASGGRSATGTGMRVTSKASELRDREAAEATAVVIAGARLLAFLSLQAVPSSSSGYSSPNSGSNGNGNNNSNLYGYPYTIDGTSNSAGMSGTATVGSAASFAFIRGCCTAGVCPEINAAASLLIDDLPIVITSGAAGYPPGTAALVTATLHDLLQSVCVLAGGGLPSSNGNSSGNGGTGTGGLSLSIGSNVGACKKACGEAGLCETVRLALDTLLSLSVSEGSHSPDTSPSGHSGSNSNSNSNSSSPIDLALLPPTLRSLVNLCWRDLSTLCANCPANQQRFHTQSWAVLKQADRIVQPLALRSSQPSMTPDLVTADITTVSLLCRAFLACPAIIDGNASSGHESRVQKLRDFASSLNGAKEALSRQAILIMSASSSTSSAGLGTASNQLEDMQGTIDKTVQAIVQGIDRFEHPSMFARCVSFPFGSAAGTGGKKK